MMDKFFLAVPAKASSIYFNLFLLFSDLNNKFAPYFNSVFLYFLHELYVLFLWYSIIFHIRNLCTSLFHR